MDYLERYRNGEYEQVWSELQLFAPYLRMAIVCWGGFPGLDKHKSSFEALGDLVAGLEPF